VLKIPYFRSGDILPQNISVEFEQQSVLKYYVRRNRDSSVIGRSFRGNRVIFYSDRSPGSYRASSVRVKVSGLDKVSLGECLLVLLRTTQSISITPPPVVAFGTGISNSSDILGSWCYGKLYLRHSTITTGLLTYQNRTTFY
jgi:hypothetical protein